MRNDKLERLFDRMQEIVESPRNKANEQFWWPQPWYRDHWRGIPRKPIDGKVAFVVEPDNAFWHNVFGLDLRDYYSKAETHLEYQLRINDFKFEHFHDNTYYDGNLFIWFGVITELSFFEPPLIMFDNREGWLGEPPLIQTEEDIERLEMPDFYRSGFMSLIHEYYNRMQELVNGRFPVMFPIWARSPYCMAVHLRGMQNLLMDMILNPKLVHKLMRFTTDARKHWMAERAKFLGRPISPGHLFNDEVDFPTLSPQLYEEFVLPYEKELSRFEGGIIYWHSCGNTTGFLELIKQTPNVGMFHIGPWTDVKKASEVLGHLPLDVCIDPVKDMLESTPEQMKQKLRAIKDACLGTDFAVRNDAIQVVKSVDEDLLKIKEWISAAKQVLQD
ncbi:methylcobalamin:coenzyme M methyltransferase [Peptococcaceae bacterium CEB3]|nr:methylcobalamin:coenzyme M methyltransferase [Peptococcaceae bacterium CEB3]